MTTSQIDPEVWYIALRRMCISNAPGSVPSTIDIEKGQRFQLDGDEIIDVFDLTRLRVMEIYTGSEGQEKLRAASLVAMEKKRNNPFRRRQNARRINV